MKRTTATLLSLLFVLALGSMASSQDDPLGQDVGGGRGGGTVGGDDPSNPTSLLVDPGFSGVGSTSFSGRAGAVYDYAPTPVVGKPVYSGLPAITIRLDDGLEDQATTANYFLERGLSVTLAINSNEIGTANNLSWQDIRQMHATARRNGARLSIAQHGNFNFANADSFPDGTENSDITIANLRAELDPTEIIQETGIRPRILVVPGDPGRRDFFNRNFAFMSSLMDEYGLWYCMTYGDWSATETIPFAPTQQDLDNATYDNLGANIESASFLVKPGMVPDRHRIITGTLDLGANAVERPTRAQWASALTAGYFSRDQQSRNPLPRSQEFSDGWTFSGKGVDTSTDSDAYGTSFRNILYKEAMPGNFGFCLALHDEENSWTSGTTLSDGITGLSDAEEVGSMHFETIAWVYRELVDRGHLRVLPGEDWCEWALGEYAIGTDLISNPKCLIPQFDIGDTIGAVSEYGFMRGVSYKAAKFTGTAVGNVSQIGDLLYASSGAMEFSRDSSDSNIFKAIGVEVDGPWGDTGGIRLVADEPDNVYFTYGPLGAGRYEWRAAMQLPGGASGLGNVGDFHITGAWQAKRMFSDLDKDATGATNGALSMADTVVTVQWNDANKFFDFDSGYDDKWSQVSVQFGVNNGYPWQFDTADYPDSADVWGGGETELGSLERLWVPFPRWGVSLQIGIPGANNDSLKIAYPQLIYKGQR